MTKCVTLIEFEAFGFGPNTFGIILLLAFRRDPFETRQQGHMLESARFYDVLLLRNLNKAEHTDMCLCKHKCVTSLHSIIQLLNDYVNLIRLKNNPT